MVAPERSRATAVESSPAPSIIHRRRCPTAATLPARLAPLRQLTTSASLAEASTGQGLTLCRVISKSCLAAEPREKSFIFFSLSSIARAKKSHGGGEVLLDGKRKKEEKNIHPARSRGLSRFCMPFIKKKSQIDYIAIK
jgi:hypothetical protein